MTPAEVVRSRLRAARGYPAVIRRGQDRCSGVTVAFGLVEAVAIQDRSIRVEAKAQDIFVQVSDYAPTGVPSEPMPNDRITVTVNGADVDYDVRPPSNAQNCFMHSNPELTEMRIHTRRVAGLATTI